MSDTEHQQLLWSLAAELCERDPRVHEGTITRS